MSSPGLFSKAVHGVRWLGITRGLSQFLMWIVTIYVVRLLQPEDYGLMAMAGIPAELATLLLDAGLGAALVMRKEVPRDVYRSANTALLGSSALTVVVIQILAWPLAEFFSEPALENVLRVIAFQFPISALAVVPNSILMKEMKFKEIGIAGALSGVGSAIITLVMALQGFRVWSLVVGFLAAAAIRMLMTNLFAGRPQGFSLRLSVLKSYLAYSANLLGQRIVWFYVVQVDRLILGKALGAEPLGRYSVARQLSHIPLERTALIVNQVTLPSFAAVQEDKDRWHFALEKMVRLVSAASFPLFFGMAAVAPIALPMLLGERWDGAVWPFILLCVALPLRATDAILTTVLLGLGRADVAFRTVLIWAAVLSPLFLLGVQFGVTGVAAVWAVGFPIVYLLATRLIASSLEIPLKGLWAPMLAPALAATGCIGSVALVYALCEGRLAPVAILAVQIASGAITYVLLLRLFSRRAFDEILDLVRRFASRGAPA